MKWRTTISILIFFTILTSTIFISISVANHDESFTEMSEYVHGGTIHIDGNEDFAKQAEAQGWPGDGTEEEPYIIEGYLLDGGEDEAILIEDVDVHFIIMDNKIEGGQYGIHLIQTSNGFIKNNTVSGVEMGIFLHASDENYVEGNIVTSNEEYGIRPSGSFNNTIKNNLLTKNSIGVALINSEDHIITGNIAFDNEHSGINFHIGNNNYVNGNKLSGHERGIELFGSNNNFIRNNTMFHNEIGFNIETLAISSENTIFDNNFIENEKQAVNRGDNSFYSETESIGNYWSDYEDRYPDAEKVADGDIWDTPYEGEIAHGFIDWYPQIEPGVPYINIQKPEDGAVIEEPDVSISWSGEYRYKDVLEYEVRLNDEEWVYIGEDTEYELTGLTNGDYTFEVRAVGLDAESIQGTLDFVIKMEPNIQVKDFSVEPDEGVAPLEVDISAEVENIGQASGDITLHIEGQEHNTWKLEPDELITIEETYEFKVPENYTVELGEQSITVDVLKGEPDIQITDFSVDPIEGVAPLDVEISAEIENVGNAKGETILELDGKEYKTWTIEPGTSIFLDESITFNETGEHTIRLNDENITIKVEEDTTDFPFIPVVIGVVLIAVVGISIYYWSKKRYDIL